MTLGACDQSLFHPVDLCPGCSCVQVATRLFDPRLARWHKADISQAPDAGKTLCLSSSQRLLHIFKPKHGHFSPPIWYRWLIYQQGEQHYARLEAKLWNKTFYFAGFVRKGWGGGDTAELSFLDAANRCSWSRTAPIFFGNVWQTLLSIRKIKMPNSTVFNKVNWQITEFFAVIQGAPI